MRTYMGLLMILILEAGHLSVLGSEGKMAQVNWRKVNHHPPYPALYLAHTPEQLMIMMATASLLLDQELKWPGVVFPISTSPSVWD